MDSSSDVADKNVGRVAVKEFAALAAEQLHPMVKRRHLCDRCGKRYASYQSLWNHRNRICKRVIKPVSQDVSDYKYVKPTILKWNGKSWETRSKNVRYQMNLGRDLSNLLERGAIKEDALNCSQKEYIQMYKTLFNNLVDNES